MLDAETIHRRRWLILAVLCFSLVLIVLDNTIVNVALPTIQQDLNANNSQLQWVVDAYILVFAGLLLTAGALGDRFGRKGALTIGLLVMATSSITSALATTSNQLIASRALMGVGGALIMPSTLSILTNVFKDPKERGRAIAVWAGTSGMAVALGPVTGGYLLEHFWWGSVFLVNLPVVAVALVAGRFIIPTSRDPKAARLDPPGALLSIAGLVSLVWAIITAGEKGWGESQVLMGFAAAAVLMVLFVLWERHTDHPMLDMSFFENPRFTAASTAITLTFFAMFGSMFMFTQFLQFVLGYTALETGVRLLPMAAVMLVVAPTSARLVERVGTKLIVASGMVVAATGLALISLLTPNSSYLALLGCMVVLSAGMALTIAPATESIMGSLPPAKAGVGSAVNDTTRQVGGALGVAVLGSIVSTTYTSHLTDAVRGLDLPASAHGVITEQLGAAIHFGRELGGQSGDVIVSAARSAFVDGMGISLLIGAAVAVLGAAVAFVALPARAHHVPAVPQPEPLATGASELVGVGATVDGHGHDGKDGQDGHDGQGQVVRQDESDPERQPAGTGTNTNTNTSNEVVEPARFATEG